MFQMTNEETIPDKRDTVITASILVNAFCGNMVLVKMIKKCLMSDYQNLFTMKILSIC
jgi:hypothetical protein